MYRDMRDQTLRERAERGQALVLLAAAFIGLAAFVGLTVDAGILFSSVGHLRRATDAAGLAAANQFREGRMPDALSAEAVEMLKLNGIADADLLSAKAYVCDLSNLAMDPPPYSAYHDDALCPGETYPPSGSDAPRKVVRIEAEMTVNFAFLPIIGWDSTTIRANAESEAASIDLVLALDISESMALDLCDDGEDNDGDGYTDADDCKGSTIVPLPEPFEDDAAACNNFKSTPWPSSPPYPTAPDAPADACWPFEDVRHAAHRLVDQMYFPYDRLSIVTFGRLPSVRLELDDSDFSPLPPGCSSTDPSGCAHKVIDSLEVEPSPIGTPLCEGTTPRGCTTTNIGDGLLTAGIRFCVDDDPQDFFCDRDSEMREEAVWITILLTDGAANAAIGDGDPLNFPDWICPDTTYLPIGIAPPPWCRESPTDRLNSNYDADDYARDQADKVGCPGPLPGVTPPAGCPALGGVGSVIFTIGLGKNVTDNPEDTSNKDAGEKLLRYIAQVGIDGQPATDPFCSPDPGTEVSCGNYYFSPDGPGLIEVFEDIASRIFTRITH